jgi:hypothetical protein
MHVHVSVCVCACMYIRRHIHTHIHTHTPTHTYTPANHRPQDDIYIYIYHAYTHTHTYTYTYTCIHPSQPSYSKWRAQARLFAASKTRSCNASSAISCFLDCALIGLVNHCMYVCMCTLHICVYKYMHSVWMYEIMQRIQRNFMLPGLRILIGLVNRCMYVCIYVSVLCVCIVYFSENLMRTDWTSLLLHECLRACVCAREYMCINIYIAYGCMCVCVYACMYSILHTTHYFSFFLVM